MYVPDVMHAKVNLCREESVVCLDVQAMDIYVELLGEDARDFVQHPYAVKTYNTKCGRERKMSVRIPFGSKNLVAVTRLETLGNITLAFVDDNVLLVVEVAKNIVTRDGMATITDDVPADSLFVEDERFLFIYLKRCLFYFVRLYRLVFIVMSLKDGQVLAPILFLSSPLSKSTAT